MNEAPILESWKEISEYLKRAVKTCQRWERELGLPIYRLDGTPNARVFAYPDELDRWIREKLHPPKTETPGSVLVLRLNKARAALSVSALIVLAIAAGLGWRFLLRKPVVFPSTRFAGLAVLPFENVTGGENLEAWRSALPELFYVKFDQSMTVGVEEPWIALRKLGLKDARKFGAEDLKRISAMFRSVDHIATGSLIESEGAILIQMSLHDAKTSEPIQTFRVTCRGEKEIFSAVDEFTKKIKLAMGVPSRLVSGDIDDKASEIVTGSPQALMLYCQGKGLIRDGRLGEAVPFFERATEIDREFGDAYYQVFVANYAIYNKSGDKRAKQEAGRYGGKALAFMDRLNVWARLDLIGDYLLRLRTDYNRAIAEYKKLLVIRGGDPMILGMLADIYSTLEDYGKVLALLDNERAKQDPRNILILANAYLLTGRSDTAETLLDDYLGKTPKASQTFIRAREICALGQMKIDEALAYNERAAIVPRPDLIEFSKAPIFITGDDFQNAEKELMRFLDKRNLPEISERFCQLAGMALSQGKVEQALSLVGSAAEKANGIYNWLFQKRPHFLRANLLRLLGDLPEALSESEKSCICYEKDDHFTDPETQAAIFTEYEDISCLPYFHLRALITLDMGRLEDFEKHLAEIKQLVERSRRPKLMRAYYHLLGHRALREKDLEKAIGHFWKALSLLPFSKAMEIWEPGLYGENCDIDSAQYFYSLAEAYFQAGRVWSALDLYEQVSPYWEERPISGELYARSFYKIAKIYDQGQRPPGTSADQIRAHKMLAIENYRKFLSLWGDADPLFTADVTDARARLAALEAR